MRPWKTPRIAAPAEAAEFATRPTTAVAISNANHGPSGNRPLLPMWCTVLCRIVKCKSSDLVGLHPTCIAPVAGTRPCLVRSAYGGDTEVAVGREQEIAGEMIAARTNRLDWVWICETVEGIAGNAFRPG